MERLPLVPRPSPAARQPDCDDVVACAPSTDRSLRRRYQFRRQHILRAIYSGLPGIHNHGRCSFRESLGVWPNGEPGGDRESGGAWVGDSYRQCFLPGWHHHDRHRDASGGTASLAVSSLAVGSHSITAVYNDDSNFNPSTSTAVTQVVNRALTSTVLTASPNPSSFGQRVTLRATVSALSPGGGTPTGSVVFKDGSTTLGTVSLSSGTATYSTTSLARGSHTITAAYQQSSSYSASLRPQ